MQGARGRRLTESAIAIQAAYRGFRARKLFRKHKQAATRIQAGWRGVQGRRLAKQLRKQRAVTVIAATWRMVKARRWEAACISVSLCLFLL